MQRDAAPDYTAESTWPETGSRYINRGSDDGLLAEHDREKVGGRGMVAGHRLPQRPGNRVLLLGGIRDDSELGRLVIQPKVQELHAAHSEHNSVFEPHKQRIAAQLNVGPELDESLRKGRFLDDRIGGNDVDAVGRLDFDGLHEEQEGSENIFDGENRLVDRLS